MILSKQRIFKKPENPTKNAKLFIIICEGKRREPDYFTYFRQIDSRVNIEVIPANQEENNSPTGLYEKAKRLLLKTEEQPNPNYEINESDEIWFVIDTDHWGEKIDELQAALKLHENWFIAQSNPCFELWLYFHYSYEAPSFNGIFDSNNWKEFVNSVFEGGFDCRKHPILITKAIVNSKQEFREAGNKPLFLSTQVFRLAEHICEILEPKLLTVRRKLDL